MSYEQAQRVLADLPDTDTFEGRVTMVFYDHSRELPVPAVLRNWLHVIDKLYEENVPRSIPPEPAKGTIEHARWRDAVNALCVPPDLSAIGAVIAYAMKLFTEHLPAMAKVRRNAFDTRDTLPARTVPLWDVIPDRHKMVDALLYALTLEDHLPALKQRLTDNVFRLSGNPKTSERIVLPEKYKGNPLDYFEGTPLLKLFDAPVPITIPEAARYMGHWICAPSGKGKTTLLLSMLLEDIERDASIIVMDSKGELGGEVRQWACIKDRLVIIEPEEEHPIQLNPLDTAHTTHTIGLLEYLFSALLDAEMTALQSTLFRSALRATLCMSDPTIETFRSIVKNGVPATNRLPADLREFFDSDFKEGTTYRDTRQQIQWRLRRLMENPVIRGMFTAKKSLLNVGELMNSRKVVVINNSKAVLGDEGSEFFGRFFLALIYGEAIQRSHLKDEEKRPVYVYIDEAQTVIRRDAKVTAIIDECRSQKIALVVAHQRVDQLEPFVASAVANCGIRMANSEDDANYLAPKLRTTAERLRSLPQGTFATVVRDYGAFELAVRKPDLPAHMSAAEQQALQEEMRRKYCSHTYSSGDIAEHLGTYLSEPSADPTKDW